MRSLACLATVALSLGCATTPPAGDDLELEEALALVTAFERKQGEAFLRDPLREPATLDDVWTILKKDRIDLFQKGIDFAKDRPDVTSRLLHAQIELAWGDAQVVLATVLHELSKVRLQPALEVLEAQEDARTIDRDGKRRLAALRTSWAENHRLIAALHKVSREHMWRGANVARTIMDEEPDSYVGYRVAADFYLRRQKWAFFDEMIAKAREHNPKSNGVTFLEGLAALQREENPERARALFRQAIARDSDFTRARVALLMSYPTLADAAAEFDELARLNPEHQLVLWAMPLVEQAVLDHRRQKLGLR